jgi:hypothetical protein
MKRLHLLAVSTLICALIPSAGWGEPPAHAPAHGYRAKQGHHPPEKTFHSGVEVVFDSGRGVHIAVGFPNVFFAAGQFYRYADTGWQLSARADGGWMAAAFVPDPVKKARGPGPAKLEGRP